MHPAEGKRKSSEESQESGNGSETARCTGVEYRREWISGVGDGKIGLFRCGL